MGLHVFCNKSMRVMPGPRDGENIASERRCGKRRASARARAASTRAGKRSGTRSAVQPDRRPRLVRQRRGKRPATRRLVDKIQNRTVCLQCLRCLRCLLRCLLSGLHPSHPCHGSCLKLSTTKPSQNIALDEPKTLNSDG